MFLGRGGGELKKVITFERTRWVKRVVTFFAERNRVTLSVGAPGDTNVSDATDSYKLIDFWTNRNFKAKT